MNETSRCYERRLRLGHFDRYLIGSGLDVGSGPDPLRVPDGKVRPWDREDGDAQYLATIPDACFDFVYSSHCLEDLETVHVALRNWVRVLRPGGWLYVVVPDYLLYERLCWPSRFNRDHRHSFSLTLTREKVRRTNHFHVQSDLLPLLEALGVEVEEVALDDEGFDYSLGPFDQTAHGAVAQICVIGRRVDDAARG